MTGDRGAGTFGTAMGLLVFLLLLLAATQTLIDLRATSMVHAAALDAAREVAGDRAGPDRCGATPAATDRFRAALGRYLERGRVELTWECGRDDAIAVRVVARHPSFLPERLQGLLPLGQVDRTVTVRVEARR